jgi:hypothetical protein
MSIKGIFFISSLLLCSCQVSGNYQYTKEGLSEKHKNETTLTYTGKINNIDYKVYNKINLDLQNLDKPPYYETSYEIWFW